MNIKQASAASGLGADTIRFYERRGVLPPPPRRPNGYRDYTARHVETLRLAVGLRALGLSPDAMGAVLRQAHGGACADVRAALGETLAGAVERLDGKIGELARARDQIAALARGLERIRLDGAAVTESGPCACTRLVGRRAA